MLLSKNIARCTMLAFALSVALSGFAFAADTKADKSGKKPGSTICNPAADKPDTMPAGKKKPAGGGC